MSAATNEKTRLMRAAAEFRWAHPEATWADVGAEVKRTASQVARWRLTEEWAEVFREVGQEYCERLAPAAVSALVRAWSKGNPSGALEVLRSFGLLRPQETAKEAEITPEAARKRLAELLGGAAGKPLKVIDGSA